MNSHKQYTSGLQVVAVITAVSGWLLPECRASIENPGLLPTPPMGFNGWSRFQCNINETIFTQTADAMISTGLQAAGYNRINLDDCWMADSRTDQNTLTWNTTTFPHGLPWLGSYLTERGFYFGIYEDAGNVTCGGYPGSYNYEAIDAETFASWGIDYLKVDGCNVSPGTEAEYHERYSTWHEVFNNMSSPLIFSQSAPAYFSKWITGSDNLTDWYTTMDYMPYNGELARHSSDIIVYALNATSWDGVTSPWGSIMQNYVYEIQLARYQVPGYYNDPDFLIADHPGLSLDEKKSQFALWASFSAPLIISAWIPGLQEDVLSYLKNSDLIAIDQDKLAQQATLVSRDGAFDVFSKSLDNSDRLVTVLNLGNTTSSTSISVPRIGLVEELLGVKVEYTAKDLWTGKTIIFQNKLEIKDLASHATAVYRISLSAILSELVIPTGLIFNDASFNCLTAESSNEKNTQIAFNTCSGADEQVWQIRPLVGTVSPLSDTSLCLTARNKQAKLERCAVIPLDLYQQWDYSVRGYLTNRLTKECVTESTQSTLSTCQYEDNSQIAFQVTISHGFFLRRSLFIYHIPTKPLDIYR
ncbi:alpha-galactosidase, putative [Talaromyces stipitatus ATCC 10500]|uniref:Alpha-galactosidase n=1 Tax=Talaromyces stipitatus (strain ATCC 10500 / CBS 375.48 / QM 6759 / NRRL 1006) TaxID=441959 RepID=B8MQX4_TALSN|nr:alpha-galactosidase, putative [Talaromyces stipitatus ATCC 10500]EED12809.1 alpha-galactosidase, putative [Talaromyces stipitatus ATCC 10500]